MVDKFIESIGLWHFGTVGIVLLVSLLIFVGLIVQLLRVIWIKFFGN